MDEERDLVVFEDDAGNELTMEVLDYLCYEGKEYALLTEYVEDADEDPTGKAVWERTGAAGPNNPLPVVARDSAGRLGAFDRRFLDRVNAVARAQGFPAFEVVETVAGGVAAVSSRLRKWRDDARRAAR